MDLPSLADVNSMRKDDLKRTLIDLINQVRSSPQTTPKTPASRDFDYGPMLNQLTSILKPMIQDSLAELQTQLRETQNELAELKIALSERKSCTDSEDDTENWAEVAKRGKRKVQDSRSFSNADFAIVVKETVKSVFDDESVKKDVIIRIPENKRDKSDVDDLCQKVESQVKPCAITRIGKPTSERTRPLKASFPTPFDARTFIAKFDACKKDNDPDNSLSGISCRPCRTRDEQARYASARAEVKKLNDDAKTSGEVSYSLRYNGDVWKFKKSGEKWVRVKEWTYSPPALRTTNSSQNDQGN